MRRFTVVAVTMTTCRCNRSQQGGEGSELTVADIWWTATKRWSATSFTINWWMEAELGPLAALIVSGRHDSVHRLQQLRRQQLRCRYHSLINIRHALSEQQGRAPLIAVKWTVIPVHHCCWPNIATANINVGVVCRARAHKRSSTCILLLPTCAQICSYNVLALGPGTILLTLSPY